MQGKWRRVHTASCRCYRLIDREYSFIFCIVIFVFAFLCLMYLQGKRRRGRVHTASCCCYRLIDREYHNLMVRFPLLSPNQQHCSWQGNFVIALFHFVYLVFVFGIWSGFPPPPQPSTPTPNIATCKDILYLHLHSFISVFCYLYLYPLLSHNHQLLLPILLQGNFVFCLCIVLFSVTCIMHLVRIPSLSPNHQLLSKTLFARKLIPLNFLSAAGDVIEDEFCFL